jgi:hydrogenase maturation protease
MGGENEIKGPKALVIGIGNEFRGDDAFGLSVAREVEALNLPGVEVVEYHGEGASLMELWNGHQTVMIIDAVQSGVTPGTLYRLDASQGKIPATILTQSSHEFGVAQAIETARVLNTLPPLLILFGAEAGQFELGAGMSEQLKQHVHAVTFKIVEELRSLGLA